MSTDNQSKIQNSKSKIVCFGEMLIDFVPTVNGVSLAEAPAFKKAPGGAPANVAAGLAKLGQAAAFMGKVGDDEFGKMLGQVIEEVGVDISALRYDATARTALAFVTLKADGEREFMFYRHPSADMLLRPEELDIDMLKNASIFHYGSISLIAEPCRSAHITALNAAEKAGVFLSYDPNLRLPLWESAEAAREGIMSIWEHAHLVKISEDELLFLKGEDSHEAARSLLTDNLKIMLVTEGSKGSRYYTKGFHGRVDGFTVQAIDATGAGDAFCAGFLSQLAQEPDLWQDEAKVRAALRYANAAGAITTTGRGAIPSLPDDAAVRELLGD